LQVLEFKNVSKTFAHKEIFTGFSWEMSEGTLVQALGNNGVGKTTLLKMAAYLVTPDTGNVLVAGQDVAKDPMSAKAQFSYLSPDERNFYWKLTGQQNLAFFASIHGLSRKVFTERISQLAQTFDLQEALNKPFQTYSSGMKQRLSLIRAFMLQRKLYLLDEPDRHLDETGLQTLLSTLETLQKKGSSILVATAHSIQNLKGKTLRVEKDGMHEI